MCVCITRFILTVEFTSISTLNICCCNVLSVINMVKNSLGIDKFRGSCEVGGERRKKIGQKICFQTEKKICLFHVNDSKSRVAIYVTS